MASAKHRGDHDYSGAADRLLNREAPPEYVSEWTAHLAAISEIEKRQLISVIIFRLRDEFLALPLSLFREVSEHCPFHTLPQRRNNVLKGFVNVRGELIICVSLEALLGVQQDDENPSGKSQVAAGRLIVCDHRGASIAFPVAEICAVEKYSPEGLTAVPATLSKNAARFVLGILSWRRRAVGCLDGEKVIAELQKVLS